MSSTVRMGGTRKGLWVGRSDEARVDWEWSGPHSDMEEVYSCLVDTRGSTPRLLVGASSSWLGPQVRISEDLGETWRDAEQAPRFPDDVDASVERVWQLTAGAEPGVVWAGTEPGAIFRSSDGGETYSLERGLWDHPHRTEWGAGFGGQVQVDVPLVFAHNRLDEAQAQAKALRGHVAGAVGIVWGAHGVAHDDVHHLADGRRLA